MARTVGSNIATSVQGWGCEGNIQVATRLSKRQMPNVTLKTHGLSASEILDDGHREVDAPADMPTE